VTLYHVLAIVAFLILAALLIRGAQRAWRRVSTWHLYALVLLGAMLGCTSTMGPAQSAGATSGGEGGCAPLPPLAHRAPSTTCGLAPCDVMWGDCDKGLGCTASLTADPNCGGCGRNCAADAGACAAVGPDLFDCVAKDGGA
jgi:hypothetical protein